MLTIPEGNVSSHQRNPAIPKTEGYEVTTSSAEAAGTTAGRALIAGVESYIRSYVTLAETSYALVIALWVVATFIWTAFDAFPYLVVTSATKRSGKTRLLELISFVASNSRLFTDISPAALYRTIDVEKPTLLLDEAEMFSLAKSEYRSLLNTGYRRGQTVKRHDGEYETYCPKAFALIGDVHDTLRDRSIVIEMKRGEAARRFVYAVTKEEGAALREMINATVSLKAEEITEAVRKFEGLSFLTDRDEEIWSPLFILCGLICPDRIDELTRAAADLAAAKTAKARRYSELGEEEDRMQEEEYAVHLLRDLLHVIGEQKKITTQEAITKLRQIQTSPWRRFRGDGLKEGIEGAMVVAGLLSRFGVKSSTIRIAPKNAGTGSTAKGYKRDALLDALAGIDGSSSVTACRVADTEVGEKSMADEDRKLENLAEPEFERLEKLQAPRKAHRDAAREIFGTDRFAPLMAQGQRRRGFPYYFLDSAQKTGELRKLVAYNHSSLIQRGVVRQTMHGLKLAWSYFHHSWEVPAGGKRTPMELFESPLLENALVKRIKYGGVSQDCVRTDRNFSNLLMLVPAHALTASSVRKALRTFTGTQGVSNFRPTAAAAIYHKLLPEDGGVVWDPSMGWGGRLLGAVACSKVKKYIGCDPATETFKELKNMEADIKRLLPERQLETSLHMLGSETKEMRRKLPEGGVDLIFSSPPYFDCEKYTNEETQSWVKYQRENPNATKDAWLTEFMGATLDNCRYALKPNGILAINIADVAGYPDLSRGFVELAEGHGWRLVETMQLSLSRMMGTRKKQTDTHKYEPIFVFKRRAL